MKTRTLQEIRDEVAKEYNNSMTWDKLMREFVRDLEFQRIDELINEVCRRAQLECGKATLETAAEKAEIQYAYWDSGIYWGEYIDKESITSESNIVIIE